MVAFIETYDILGSRFSIEDLEDGRPMDEHFMGGDARWRFSCWRGGCGIGQYDTLEGARTRIRNYVLTAAAKRRREAVLSQQAAISVINALGTGPLSHLEKFREGGGEVDDTAEEKSSAAMIEDLRGAIGELASLRKTVLRYESAIKAVAARLQRIVDETSDVWIVDMAESAMAELKGE